MLEETGLEAFCRGYVADLAAQEATQMHGGLIALIVVGIIGAYVTLSAVANRLLNTLGKTARAVLDLLAEDDACGWESPSVRYTVEYGHAVVIPEQWTGVVEPLDAEAMARALLRAAQSARAADAEKGTTDANR
jgi:uncharacterized membrane protein YeaQ/YmgE (transglycosylase-associated protein family)